MDQQLVFPFLIERKMSDHQKIYKYPANVTKKQQSSKQYQLFATNCIVSRQMVDEKINEHLKEKISFYGLFDFTLKKKEIFQLLSRIMIKIKSCLQSYPIFQKNIKR
jgi:hypothetical protein